MAEQYQKLVEDFHKALFVQHDVRAAAQLYTEDATLWDPMEAGPVKGRTAIEKNLSGYVRAFPDISGEIINVFGSGDRFAAELLLRGSNTGPLELEPGKTAPPTGKRVEMRVCWVGRVAPDGRCSEDHTYYDSASFMQQLGLG